MKRSDHIHGGVFGVAIGDALGVPVEFCSRASLDENPVKDMRSGGVHGQVVGTWSDDSSLTFCLMQSLLSGKVDLNDIAGKFLSWLRYGYWTPHGTVFDRGIATTKALIRFEKGSKAELSGGMDEFDNGNGSLMRILPLVFITGEMPVTKRYELVKKVSSITHMHFRSVFACFIYTEYARILLRGVDKFEAYELMLKEVKQFISVSDFNSNEINRFSRVLNGEIHELAREGISGSGYVLHTLEASFWSFLTTDTFSDAVLKSVNLGEDTDTTGAVTGGLAGLYYGSSELPKKWMVKIALREDIEQLITEFEAVVERFN